MTKKKTFAPPFRLGRKQKRAVLDSLGREVVIFPVGMEDYAIEYIDFLNTTTPKDAHNASIVFDDNSFPMMFIPDNGQEISQNALTGTIMFQFDDEAPVPIADVYNYGKFSIEMCHPKESEEQFIEFKSESGKVFTLIYKKKIIDLTLPHQKHQTHD